MIYKHIAVIIYSIVIPLLITHFDIDFINVVPNYDIRIKLLPLLFCTVLISVYIIIFLLYFIFKIFYQRKVTLKKIINEFITKYVFCMLSCTVVFLILKKLIESKIVLFIPELFLALIYSYYANNYIKTIDSEKKKRFIAVIIIFIFFLIF